MTFLHHILSVSLLLFLSLHAIAAAAPPNGTASSFLVNNNWQVENGSLFTCAQDSCCCFTGPVNIYVLSSTGELYVNGTVAGKQCDQPVEQDNLDQPSSYTFMQEFFGIDKYTFTLANATYNGNLGWSLTASALLSSHPNCSFVLFHPSTTLLPSAPYNPPVSQPGLPSYGQSYLGTWNFDSTICNVTSANCCCLVGSASIVTDPDGSQSYFISGNPSSGCNVPSGQSEQDDFPWPASGTSTSSQTVVDGFLENQDNYNITLTLNGSTYAMYFQDLTNPQCSMKATRRTSGAISLMQFSSGLWLLIALAASTTWWMRF